MNSCSRYFVYGSECRILAVHAVLEGAINFIPEVKQYEINIPTPLIEYVGYCTCTNENWSLIGDIEVENFVSGISKSCKFNCPCIPFFQVLLVD